MNELISQILFNQTLRKLIHSQNIESSKINVNIMKYNVPEKSLLGSMLGCERGLSDWEDGEMTRSLSVTIHLLQRLTPLPVCHHSTPKKNYELFYLCADKSNSTHIYVYVNLKLTALSCVLCPRVTRHADRQWIKRSSPRCERARWSGAGMRTPNPSLIIIQSVALSL